MLRALSSASLGMAVRALHPPRGALSRAVEVRDGGRLVVVIVQPRAPRGKERTEPARHGVVDHHRSERGLDEPARSERADPLAVVARRRDVRRVEPLDAWDEAAGRRGERDGEGAERVVGELETARAEARALRRCVGVPRAPGRACW